MSKPFTQHSSASATSLLPGPSKARSDGHGGKSSQYAHSLSDKYSLAPSPVSWGTPLLLDTAEPDDFLHNPDPKRDRKSDRGGHIFTARGIGNLGCLFILAAGCLMLFLGFPLLSHFLTKKQTNQGGFNLGGINATGQIADMPGNFGLIDRDTPQDVFTKKSYQSPNDEWTLVFSDEFNIDGRTFYPGDDPYWEAVDLHYWGTNDLEWYDPEGATTKGGALRLTLSKVAPIDNHNLTYRSGMIQSWNKFCFTGGLIEAAVTLPGANNINGLWPAIWTMGNLGRAGFGASLEGLWPYTYDSCDVGTLPNQTYPGTATPLAAVQNGDPSNGNVLSYLPGQRLSACTCPGESHPGPMRSDGSYVGRAAPEIDIFEATIEGGHGKVSMSAQWAPFNAEYKWRNTTANMIMYEPDVTVLNTYAGGAYQQTTSGLSTTNQDCYELGTACYSLYGFEYKPGFDNAYITWINDGKPSWTIRSAGMGPDPLTEISTRPIPQEPMYIIANLGFSLNFGGIDFDRLTLPTTMSIDYIRVYQPKDSINIGCDPPDFPTATYINAYPEAYTNNNLTLWTTPSYNQTWPKNRLNGGCS
ncbi:beta-glucan synthesis-associated protein SKN1 [Infundibulicybe gibba]|nr:beta-glucan synthesis-associated protein SKN1 [Infundibulicybe gibba]